MTEYHFTDIFAIDKLQDVGRGLSLDWRRLAVALGFDRLDIEGFEYGNSTQQDTVMRMLTRYRCVGV